MRPEPPAGESPRLANFPNPSERAQPYRFSETRLEGVIPPRADAGNEPVQKGRIRQIKYLFSYPLTQVKRSDT